MNLYKVQAISRPPAGSNEVRAQTFYVMAETPGRALGMVKGLFRDNAYVLHASHFGVFECEGDYALGPTFTYRADNVMERILAQNPKLVERVDPCP